MKNKKIHVKLDVTKIEVKLIKNASIPFIPIRIITFFFFFLFENFFNSFECIPFSLIMIEANETIFTRANYRCGKIVKLKKKNFFF